MGTEEGTPNQGGEGIVWAGEGAPMVMAYGW